MAGQAGSQIHVPHRNSPAFGFSQALKQKEDRESLGSFCLISIGLGELDVALMSVRSEPDNMTCNASAKSR